MAERKKPQLKKHASYKVWEKPVEPVEEVKIELFPKADRDFVVMMRRKITPTKDEMDEIFRLYRKYVKWVYAYTTTCQCATSIASLWNGLSGWVAQNDAKFEH